MAQPQSGLIPEANAHAIFLTLELARSEAAAVRCRDVLARLPGLTDEIAAQAPHDALTSVVAVGATAWQRVFPGGNPVGLVGFRSFADAGRLAPATAADLFVHLRSDRFDLCFELGRRLRAALGDTVRVIEDIHGFRYLDSRDLTGFVDGTENPHGDADRLRVAAIPDGPFAGGSFVNVQRYVHALDKWGRLATPDQENVIGRTKADDIEFTGDRLPATAHIKRVSVKEDGKSLKILRHSMPYGTASEHGLYFVAYAARPDAFPRMLERMIVADDAGHYDHLMDYARAVTGAAFFAPARDWLEVQGG